MRSFRSGESFHLLFLAHVRSLTSTFCIYFVFSSFSVVVLVALRCIAQLVEDQRSALKSFWHGVQIECIETLEGKHAYTKQFHEITGDDVCYHHISGLQPILHFSLKLKLK